MFFKFIDLSLAVLGVHCCVSFSLVVMSRGCCLVAGVHGRLIAVACLVAEDGR